MKKTILIITVIILVLALCIGGGIFLFKDKVTPEAPQNIVPDTSLKVVSHVKLKTWTTDGAIVVMDDSSSFAQLNVFIPRSYLDNKYVGGDYLSVYHNGVIKDGAVAEFEYIYSVEDYHIESISLYNEWKVPSPVGKEDSLFIETVWPAIVKNFPGNQEDIKPLDVLAQSHSYNPIFAVLCSIHHGENKDSLSVYYVQVTGEDAVVLMSESLLVSLSRLTQ